MRSSALILTLVVVSALNLLALAANLSLPLRADVGGLTYQDLVHDDGFVHAVKSIAESSCAVNVDIGRLKCQ